MQELRLVAVSEDGTYAVLAVPGRGGRFVLPIDDRLRTVARGQFSRLAQYEIEVENPLRPKEIQDRIRAGETADEIADAAGIPIDRVRRFEGPVLAEREYRAQEAQRSTVRGHTESGPGPRLGEIVAERLADAGAPSDTLAWDSRKRADGNWQVQLQFTLENRPQLAEWVFDPRRRHVYPADDLARRLCLPEADWPAGRLGTLGAPSATVTPIGSRLGGHHADSRPEGDQTEPDRALARGAHAAPAASPAHAPWSREAREPGWQRETPTVPVPAARPPEPARVPEPARTPEQARPGAAAPARPEAPAAAHAGGSARTQDESRPSAPRTPEAAAGNARTGGTAQAGAPAARPGGPGTGASPAPGRPAAPQSAAGQRPAAAQPGAAQRATTPTAPARAGTASDATAGDAAHGAGPAQPAAETTEPAARPAEPETPARPGRKAGRNRRSSVPSWDEIMLGNSRQPD